MHWKRKKLSWIKNMIEEKEGKEDGRGVFSLLFSNSSNE